jgi:hypothetical protein
MYTPKNVLWLLSFIICLACTSAAHAADSKSTANLPPPRSVFIQPTSTREGRDPFYPESTRNVVEQRQQPVPTAPTQDLTPFLKVHGISGSPGSLLVIINNHSFAVGDEGDVLIPGGRIRLRCLEIRPDGASVEVNGHIQQLNMETKK